MGLFNGVERHNIKSYIFKDNNLFYFFQSDPVVNICHAADKQLFTLVEWAKCIPHFTELPIDDQVILLRAGVYARGVIVTKNKITNRTIIIAIENNC